MALAYVVAQSGEALRAGGPFIGCLIDWLIVMFYFRYRRSISPIAGPRYRSPSHSPSDRHTRRRRSRLRRSRSRSFRRSRPGSYGRSRSRSSRHYRSESKRHNRSPDLGYRRSRSREKNRSFGSRADIISTVRSRSRSRGYSKSSSRMEVGS